MGEFVTLQERLEKVLESAGVGSHVLAGQLVGVVRDLATSLREEESEPVTNDFERGFEAGWENAFDCFLHFCDTLLPMDEDDE